MVNFLNFLRIFATSYFFGSNSAQWASFVEVLVDVILQVFKGIFAEKQKILKRPAYLLWVSVRKIS